ncbi:MAG: SDR family oxidoreductase [Spirosomataceae bacterium]
MFQQKVVIITGGSSGIGKALAQELGRQGARVVITGRREKELFDAANELQQEGIQVLAIVSDVSVQAQTYEVVQQTLEKFGRVDILINNAGLTMRSMFEDADVDATIRRLMDVNFMGTVYMTQAALPHIKRTKGSIVGISSIAGYRGLPVRTGYSASKFALNGFLEALRSELLPQGVHVLTACPGFTASNIRFSALDAHGQAAGSTVRDEGKMMSSEEVAHRIAQAIARRKRTLILTSEGILTVWLNKLFPRLTDWLVIRELAKEKDSPLREYVS